MPSWRAPERTSRSTLDATGAKANLFATLGPHVDGGIMLSGHTDVVPVEGQEWTGDPFALREHDGRLYGRGACDMKGFIACVLATVPTFAQANLARPVHFAFTYDEEVGCLGARALADVIRRADIRPSLAIIGEPTRMRIVEGHKGCYEYAVEFTGLEGHSSLPDAGVNAVEHAVRYVAKLMELGQTLRARAPAGSPLPAALDDASSRPLLRRRRAQRHCRKLRRRLGDAAGAQGRRGAGPVRDRRLCRSGAAARDARRWRRPPTSSPPSSARWMGWSRWPTTRRSGWSPS